MKDELIAFLRECPILPSELNADGSVTIAIADDYQVYQIELTADEVKMVQAGEVRE